MEKKIKQSSTAFFGTKFINPEDLIEKMDFKPGMKVANFGCGTGYFAMPIAKKVAPDGIVWAIDIRAEKLEVVESYARIFGVTNIIVRRANLEAERGSGISNSEADWVVMANMLFQNSNKNAILSEAKRVLKKDGRIFLIEWSEKDFPIGPNKRIKISQKEMIKIARENNLEVEKEVEVSNFHYGLLLKNKNEK